MPQSKAPSALEQELSSAKEELKKIRELFNTWTLIEYGPDEVQVIKDRWGSTEEKIFPGAATIRIPNDKLRELISIL